MMSVQRLIRSCFLPPCTLLRERNIRIKKCVFAPGCVDGGGMVQKYRMGNISLPSKQQENSWTMGHG